MKLHSVNFSNNRLISLPNEIGNLKKVQFMVSSLQGGRGGGAEEGQVDEAMCCGVLVQMLCFSSLFSFECHCFYSRSVFPIHTEQGAL